MNSADLGWCGDFATTWENSTFVRGLHEAGYNTGLVGKFFNEEPTFCGENIHVPRGFDTFFAMCQEVRYYNISYNDNGVMLQTGDAPTDYGTSVIGNRSLAFLEAATANGTQSQPFFLYLAVHAPHLPAIPAPWYSNATVPSKAPRAPNWNAGREGKHWQVSGNPPMDDYFVGASDAVFADRMRTLLSVDDIISEVVATLSGAGVLDNTYIVFTSDHGYHNGQYALWAEKSQIYDTDTRIPFIVRGPGVPAGATSDALVSAIDVGATLLELAGAVPPGSRTTDGRSFASLLTGGGSSERGVEPRAVRSESASGDSLAQSVERAWAEEDDFDVPGSGAPVWPRDRVLIEFPGYPTQYLGPCNFVPGEAAPNVPCPRPPNTPLPLIDDPSNSYSALRIINATHDVLYAEYRPGGSAIVPGSTNFTEAYDYAADPWALVNKALPGPDAWPRAVLQQLSKELWAVANCKGEACP